MLKEFGPDIWTADGPIVTAAAGFHYPTRMAVIRLRNRDLVLWSPVKLSSDLRLAIEALGAVRHLVPPNSLHHTWLSEWREAFPEAKIYAPAGLREKRRDIVFDDDLRCDIQISAWAGEIDIAIVEGNRITTEAVLFHRRSETAIFADLLQQFPQRWFKGWRGLVARLDLMVATEPSVPRKFRIAFTDRRAARTALDHILAWPTKNVLMAHGTPITANGQAFLRHAFRWLASE